MAKQPKPSKKPKSFLVKPFFEGGISGMRALIKENMKYPKEAIDQKIEGNVKIKYDVDYKGKVIKTKVIKGLGYGCDEEAQRLVKLFEFNVEKTRKMRVTFHKTIQINFNLPKEKPKKAPAPKKKGMSLQYQVSSANKTEAPAPKKSYSYTITIN